MLLDPNVDLTVLAHPEDFFTKGTKYLLPTNWSTGTATILVIGMAWLLEVQIGGTDLALILMINIRS